MPLDCAQPKTGALFYSPLFPQHLAGAPDEKALPEHGTDPSFVDTTRAVWLLVQGESGIGSGVWDAHHQGLHRK